MPLRDSTACNDDKTNKRNTKRKNEQEVTHPMTPVNVQRVSDALKKKPAAINAIKSKSLALFFFFFLLHVCVSVSFILVFFFFAFLSLTSTTRSLLRDSYTQYIYMSSLSTPTPNSRSVNNKRKVSLVDSLMKHTLKKKRTKQKRAFVFLFSYSCVKTPMRSAA